DRARPLCRALTCLTFAHIMASMNGRRRWRRRAAVSGRTHGERQAAGATRGVLLAAAPRFAAFAAGCSGFPGSSFWSGAPPPPPAQPGTAIGTGQVKVGLILPLSARGNAGLGEQSMKNAAELALSEFNRPNLQLLGKD